MFKDVVYSQCIRDILFPQEISCLRSRQLRLDLVRRTSSRLAENNIKKQTGNSEHLDEAISTMEQTLAIRGECLRPLVLGDLGAMLYERFERTGSLDEAI